MYHKFQRHVRVYKDVLSKNKPILERMFLSIFLFYHLKKNYYFFRGGGCFVTGTYYGEVTIADEGLYMF